jgi:hypothetical protein
MALVIREEFILSCLALDIGKSSDKLIYHDKMYQGSALSGLKGMLFMLIVKASPLCLSDIFVRSLGILAPRTTYTYKQVHPQVSGTRVTLFITYPAEIFLNLGYSPGVSKNGVTVKCGRISFNLGESCMLEMIEYE